MFIIQSTLHLVSSSLRSAALQQQAGHVAPGCCGEMHHLCVCLSQALAARMPSTWLLICQRDHCELCSTYHLTRSTAEVAIDQEACLGRWEVADLIGAGGRPASRVLSECQRLAAAAPGLCSWRRHPGLHQQQQQCATLVDLLLACRLHTLNTRSECRYRAEQSRAEPNPRAGTHPSTRTNKTPAALLAYLHLAHRR